MADNSKSLKLANLIFHLATGRAMVMRMPSNVGLTLSGGGVRAVVFHLGVLEWLAKTPLWNSVSQISTVSGGSLMAGLLFARTGFRWPAPEAVPKIIESIQDLLCTGDLQKSYVNNYLQRPYLILQGRAALLADALARTWQIDASLSDLPDFPHLAN